MARKLDAAKKTWSWKIGYKRQAGALGLFGALGPVGGSLFGAHLGPIWGPFYLGPIWDPFGGVLGAMGPFGGLGGG